MPETSRPISEARQVAGYNRHAGGSLAAGNFRAMGSAAGSRSFPCPRSFNAPSANDEARALVLPGSIATARSRSPCRPAAAPKRSRDHSSSRYKATDQPSGSRASVLRAPPPR